jgi:hypothetical protein
VQQFLLYIHTLKALEYRLEYSLHIGNRWRFGVGTDCSKRWRSGVLAWFVSRAAHACDQHFNATAIKKRARHPGVELAPFCVGPRRTSHSSYASLVKKRQPQPYLIRTDREKYSLINYSLVSVIISKTSSISYIEGVTSRDPCKVRFFLNGRRRGENENCRTVMSLCFRDRLGSVPYRVFFEQWKPVTVIGALLKRYILFFSGGHCSHIRYCCGNSDSMREARSITFIV